MFLLRQADPAGLVERLRNAPAASPALMREVVDKACRRFPSLAQREKTARVELLICDHAWTDAALALIELELPRWQLRRIGYDGGEWHCALSRARELPDWLDQSIEAHHADLPLALLSAFVEVQQLAAESSGPSVPSAPSAPGPLSVTVNAARNH